MKQITNQIEQLEKEAEEAEYLAKQASRYKELIANFDKFSKGEKSPLLVFGNYFLFNGVSRGQDTNFVMDAPDFVKDYFAQRTQELERRVLDSTSKPYTGRIEGCIGNLRIFSKSAKENGITLDTEQIITNLVRSYRPKSRNKLRTLPLPFVEHEYGNDGSYRPIRFHPYLSAISDGIDKKKIFNSLRKLTADADLESALNTFLFLSTFESSRGVVSPERIDTKSGREILDWDMAKTFKGFDEKKALGYLDRTDNPYQVASFVSALERMGLNLENKLGDKKGKVGEIFQDAVRAPGDVYDELTDDYFGLSLFPAFIAQKYNPHLFEAGVIKEKPLKDYLDYMTGEYGKRSDFVQQAPSMLRKFPNLPNGRDCVKEGYVEHLARFFDWCREGKVDLKEDRE